LMGAACSRLLRISPKLLHASEQSQYFEEGWSLPAQSPFYLEFSAILSMKKIRPWNLEKVRNVDFLEAQCARHWWRYRNIAFAQLSKFISSEIVIREIRKTTHFSMRLSRFLFCELKITFGICEGRLSLSFW
jgi:hypothetical protein